MHTQAGPRQQRNRRQPGRNGLIEEQLLDPRRYRAPAGIPSVSMEDPFWGPHGVDPRPDTGRPATIRLRFGVHRAFRPAPTMCGEHLLYVGRLSREKRVDDLIAAASRLDPPRPVVLVGDGPERQALARRARREGMAASVRLHPYVRDREALARLYREAACVVDPGPHETFGLVVFEAATSGARVVACDSTPAVAAADGLIETFVPTDVADLVRAIERSLARPDVPAVQAALAARSTWENVFAVELSAVERIRR